MQVFNYEEISIVKGAFVLNLMYAQKEGRFLPSLYTENIMHVLTKHKL